MKKLHLLFIGVFAALAIVACSDDELETETKPEDDTESEEGNTGKEEEAPQAYITLSAAELQFARTGGEATVTVDANYDWDCEYESDWFTVVADTNAGTLTVTCELNTTGEVREGTVTVTTSDGEENVAEATLEITQEDFEAAALVLEYTITSDNTTIQLPLGEKDWDDNVFAVDCTVDWGDGGEEETVTGSWPSHTYSEAGTYTVIINGKVELLCDYDYDTLKNINGVECLTAVKQWGDLGLKSMDSAFYYCTNLTSLPEGAGPFSNVTSFYWAFGECSSLATLPENMLSNCTSATDFSYTFDYCSSLTTVPEDIFSGCTAVVNFSWAFAETSLTSVSENLFADCHLVEYFEGVFSGCTSLVSIPESLFANCPSVESFWGVFDECTSLTSVPENLFANCPSVGDFGWAFDETSLTSVPEKLFANCPLVKYFDGVFYGCESLGTVPVGIFDNNKSVIWFDYAFYNCSKLVGESPYTMIDEEKVHLYEREDYPEYFTVPTYYEECFTDCTFSDMDSIPSSWGGNGTSPTSVTPQSLNPTVREERRPSRLAPHRDASTPQGPTARPLPTRK